MIFTKTLLFTLGLVAAASTSTAANNASSFDPINASSVQRLHLRSEIPEKLPRAPIRNPNPMMLAIIGGVGPQAGAGALFLLYTAVMRFGV